MPKELLKGDDLLKYLDTIEREGMGVTKQWHSIWQAAVMYVWGQQLDGLEKKEGWEYLVFNYIYPLVMQGIAKESKNNPKILGRAWNDENANYAEQWQGVIQYIWEQVLSMRVDEIYALLDSAVYGYSVGKAYWEPKAYWDEDKNQWIGEIRHYIVHPACFWVDKNAERLKDKPACGTVRKVELEWAVQQWPDFEDELREEAKGTGPDDEYYNYSETGYGRFAMPGTIATPTEKAHRLRDFGAWMVSLILTQKDDRATTGVETKKFVWLKETYFPDETTEHIKVEDAVSEKSLLDSGEAYAEQPSGVLHWSKSDTPIPLDDWPKQTLQDFDRPIFPKGRYVIRVGKTILNPEIDDQKYQFSRWPFNVLVHHVLPHTWQGSNAVEASRSSQDMLNLSMAQLIHYVKLNADPIKVVEDGSLSVGADGKVRKIKGLSGEIIIAKRGKAAGIHALENGRIGQELPSLIGYLRQDIEEQNFMHPTAQGAVAQKDMTRAEAVIVNTNANDLVALRSIFVEKWIEGTAIVIAELAQKYYDLGRQLRIIGSDGNKTNREMSPELKDVKWDLEIESGSTLPFDEDRRKNDYMMAYKMLGEPTLNPLLDDMLRILNIGNRNKVLAKHQQTQLFKQFMALAKQTQQMMGQQVDPAQLQMIQQQLMQKVMGLLQQAAQPAGTAAPQPQPPTQPPGAPQAGKEAA